MTAHALTILGVLTAKTPEDVDDLADRLFAERFGAASMATDITIAEFEEMVRTWRGGFVHGWCAAIDEVIETFKELR